LNKQKTLASQSLAHEGLTQAITDMESATAELARLNAAVREMPGKLAEAEAQEAQAHQALDDAYAESMTSALSDGVTPEIAALESALAEKTNAVQRVRGLSAGIGRQVERQHAEIATRRPPVDAALNRLVSGVRDELAELVTGKARELADLYAAYEAFLAADANKSPSDWLKLAHVSDPRVALALPHPTLGRYDRAPNLLKEAGHENSPIMTALRPALEPMRKAHMLLARTANLAAGAAHA